MSSIQPSTLSTEELLRYSWLIGADKLDAQWVIEVLRRLEACVDAEESEKETD